MKTFMKTTKALFGIFTITAALAMQVHAQTFLTNGLVAYYPFNGNANDMSGNGNNGTNNASSGIIVGRFEAAQQPPQGTLEPLPCTKPPLQ
jgi:hypothetical protein